MIYLWIYLTIIIMIAAYLVTFYIKNRNIKHGPTVFQMGKIEFREELINELGAEILNFDEEQYLVNYHGGVFNFIFSDKNEVISILFDNFTLTNEESEKAYKIVNSLNSKYRWSTFLHYDTEKHLFVAHCHISIYPQSTPLQCSHILKRILDTPFDITREFWYEMKERDNKKGE